MIGGGGIVRAAWVVAAGILLSRMLGFVRSVVLASRLGDTPVADAYEAAFILPEFLNYLLAGAFLAITFIPILSRFYAAGDREGAQRSFLAVFRVVAAASVVLTCMAMVGAGVIVEWLFGSEGRLDPDQVAEITRLTRLLLPVQVFFMIGGLFMAVQYASGRFLIPVLAPAIHNVGIISGGLLGTRSGEVSATGFILGAVIGGLLGHLILQWWGASHSGMRVALGYPDFRHPAFKEYLRLAIPLMIGQSIGVLDESIGKVVVAAAADGSIFALNLARRVNMLPVGVIAQAAGMAAYPFLARMVAEGRRGEMLESMGRTVRMVVFSGGAAVAGVIAVSQPAVRTAFQHGEFSAEGTVLTAAALVGYSLSIPAWGVQQIFGRSFYAHRQMWIPVIAGTAWTIPAIPMYLFGFHIAGVPGVALASSLAITGHALTLGLLWRRFHTSEGLEGMLRTAGQMLVSASVAAPVGWLTAEAITGGPAPGFGTSLVATLLGLSITGLTYLLVSLSMGSREAHWLLRPLSQRFFPR